MYLNEALHKASLLNLSPRIYDPSHMSSEIPLEIRYVGIYGAAVCGDPKLAASFADPAAFVRPLLEANIFGFTALMTTPKCNKVSRAGNDR